MFEKLRRGISLKLVSVIVFRDVPSWNSLYRYGRGRFYKSKIGKEFDKLVKSILPKLMKDEVVIEVFADKGRRNWDIDNLMKALLDSFKGLVYNDDSKVRGIVAFKVQFGYRRVEVRIWEVQRKSGVYQEK